MSRENQAERIGRMIRDRLGEPDEAGIDPAEKAVFSAMEQLSTQRRSFRLYGAAAAIAVIAGSVILGRFVRPSAVTYQIGDGAIENETADWVRNSDLPQLPIVFENGSRFVLERQTIVKVVESDADRVRIDLNRGSLEAHVNGNGHTEWWVDAGPYSVRVLGTVFTVDWDPDAERLEVAVTSGHVSVQGEDIGKGVVLDAGRRLVSLKSDIHIDSPSDNDASVSDVSIAKQNVVATANEAGIVERSITPASSGHRTVPVNRHSTPSTPVAKAEPLSPLQSRIDARDWTSAVALLEETGAEETARSAALDVLWHLADAARRSGRSALSEQLFISVRRRFPRTERAATAAFLLGKIALDAHRDPAAAERRFNAYLYESPGGALSEEALGRLIEVYSALGQKEVAARAALRYLDRYPNGSFAESARRHAAPGMSDTAAR